MATMTSPCCSVTMSPAVMADGAYQPTICQPHYIEGWRVVANQYRGRPGVDRYQTSTCGCVRLSIAQTTITRCALHMIGPRACCEQASRLACVCADSYACPEHGDAHFGSHE